MREIKFRGIAKCILQDGWMYGHYYVDDDYGVHVVDYCKVDGDTVGQFTGLHDRNGKEIYEGDFLRLRTTQLLGIRETFINISSDSFHRNVAFIENEINNSISYRLEIIGNIHEQEGKQ